MIRPYRDDDFDVVTALWFEAMHVAMPEMMKRMGFELEGAREYFRNAIILQDQLWVYEFEGAPVAFLGMENDFLDRLYVDPKFHRQGFGQALLDYAKTLSPKHLWLYTHWHTVLIIPPLIITEEQLKEGMDILDKALEITDNVAKK